MKKLLFLILLIPVLVFSELHVMDDGTEVYIDSTGWGVHLMFPSATWWIDYEGDSLGYNYLMTLADDSLGATIYPIGTPGYIEHPDPAFDGTAVIYWLGTFIWAASADSIEIVLYNQAGAVVQSRSKRPDTGSRTDLNDYGVIILNHVREHPQGRVYVNGMRIYPEE